MKEFIKLAVASRSPEIYISPSDIVTILENAEHHAEFTLTNGMTYISRCTFSEFLSLTGIELK